MLAEGDALSAGGCFSFECRELAACRGATEGSGRVYGAAVHVRDTGRRATDLCILLDTSGSMASEAKLGQELAGLALLDLAKHGVRTAVHAMGPEDRLALIAFDHGATVLRSLTPVHDASTEMAVVDPIVAGGGTNIGAALEKAFHIFRGSGRPEATWTCFLLTDGETSDKARCARLVSELTLDGKRPQVCCFGVGYEIDSQLLVTLAWQTGGFFTFVPDAGFMGTAFVQGCATVLTAALENCVFAVDDEDGTSAQGDLWEGPLAVPGDASRAQYGTLTSGGSAYAFWTAPPSRVSAPYMAASAYGVGGRAPEESGAEAGGPPAAGDAEHLRWAAERIRVRVFGNLLRLHANALAQQRVVEAGINELGQVLAMIPREAAEEYASTEALCTGMLFDLQGEASAACAPAQYNVWGKHYLASLSFAHLFRLTLNFKDPGIQNYMRGSASDLRDAIDRLYNTLPEPTSSLRRRQGAVPQMSMAAMNNSDNICIHGACLVRSRLGLAELGAVRAGDRIYGLVERRPSHFVTELLLVEAVCHQRVPASELVAPFASCPSLQLTRGHPVARLEHFTSGARAAWCSTRSPGGHDEGHDATAGGYSDAAEKTATVVSLVFKDAEARGVALVGQDGSVFVASALGHGMTDTARYGLAAHHYLGARDSVLRDLARCTGYPNVDALKAIRNDLGHVHALVAA